MIKRLPRYAELKLQSLCAEAGALCHGVDEDESGWDCLIEFPEKDFPGPADARLLLDTAGAYHRQLAQKTAVGPGRIRTLTEAD